MMPISASHVRCKAAALSYTELLHDVVYSFPTTPCCSDSEDTHCFLFFCAGHLCYVFSMPRSPSPHLRFYSSQPPTYLGILESSLHWFETFSALGNKRSVPHFTNSVRHQRPFTYMYCFSSHFLSLSSAASIFLSATPENVAACCQPPPGKQKKIAERIECTAKRRLRCPPHLPRAATLSSAVAARISFGAGVGALGKNGKKDAMQRKRNHALASRRLSAFVAVVRKPPQSAYGSKEKARGYKVKSREALKRRRSGGALQGKEEHLNARFDFFAFRSSNEKGVRHARRSICLTVKILPFL